MLGLSSRFDMQVGVITGHACGLHGSVCAVGGQLLQLIVDLLADQIALLHPSHLAGGGSDLHEVAIMVENFDAVAVFYDADFVIGDGDPVAQVDLHSGNVSDFEDASAGVFAAREQSDREDECEECEAGIHG